MYGNGNYLSYAKYGDRNGYPILIQHGLIASIDNYDLFDQLIQLNSRLICVADLAMGNHRLTLWIASQSGPTYCRH